MKAFVAQIKKNKAPPPEPKDEEEKRYFEEFGIVFLEDEFEKTIVSAFFRCIEFDELWRVNAFVVDKYAAKFEMEFVDLWEIMSQMCESLNA